MEVLIDLNKFVLIYLQSTNFNIIDKNKIEKKNKNARETKHVHLFEATQFRNSNIKRIKFHCQCFLDIHIAYLTFQHWEGPVH